MGNIVLLDELTINKIAAGEVIERPASVIKEMVENSIDAKATNITVEIRNGGISYIKITDNGKGIEKDDLEMAFERHATSKIRSAEDLNTVMSMGFRGEALASIAAISNVELISKTENQETGYKVTVEGGHVLDKEEIGCQTGTSIIVRNLFFNTPVRYKFLKKDYTETGYIEDAITRIALVNPNIAIKLINTGKTIISTSGNGNLRDAVYSIYGKDVAQGILDVNYKYEDVNIVGVIGKPELARSNRSNQIFFVNNRYIKDRILTSAVEQAYKNKIEAGKFAFAVLNLQIPPHKVDVNVHPAKLEVRFEEENKIFKAVFHAIEDALAKTSNDDVVKMDNKIIQSSNNVISVPKEEETEKVEEKEKRFSSFLNRRKNKYNFGDDNNIIEDLYNQKKTDQFPAYTETKTTMNNIFSDKKEMPSVENVVELKHQEKLEDNVVNTSDVLQELKTLSENIKKDLNNEVQAKEKTTPKAFNNYTQKEEKQLPDGTTYTYVGENKEKIESLLRQLHPELTQNGEVKVAEDVTNYNIENKVEAEAEAEVEPEVEAKAEVEPEVEVKAEEKIEAEEIVEASSNIEEIKAPSNINSKFELIRQNLEKLDANEQPFNQMYEKLFGTPVINDEVEQQKQVEEEQAQKINAIDIVNDNVSMFEGIEEYSKPTYKFIGIVFGSYIVAEIEKEMYIINEKIAREKIMFEKLTQSYYNQSKKDAQMLLLPDIINLSSKEMEVARENMEMFAQAGFVLEEFGENTIKLSGVPTVCLDLNTKELFYQIIDEINTVARTSKQEKEEKFIETIAEKVVEKNNSVTSIQEVDNLMEKILKLPEPFIYLDNKQVAIKMTKYDIERKFSRK